MAYPKELLTFNRGIVSKLGLARFDVDKLTMSAEEQTNWMPRVLGSMMLRPGLAFQNETKENRKAKHLTFQFAIDDKALIELTANCMRVKVNDLLLTRPSAAPATDFGSGNTEFTDNITGWDTSETEVGATTPAWVTGGYLGLKGGGDSDSVAKSSITMAPGASAAVRILVGRGPVEISIGTEANPDRYFSRASYDTGEHSLAFTFGSDSVAVVRFYNRETYTVLISECSFDTGGDGNYLELETPWEIADFPYIRSRASQSGDVMYISCRGRRPRKIERRDNGSWSIVRFEPKDGPFRKLNTSDTSITPSAITGDITLTATTNVFVDGHVGALWKIESQGQDVTRTIGSEDVWSDPIRISGIGDARGYTSIRSGLTGSGNTVHIQSAFSELGPWVDAAGPSSPFTTDGETYHRDDLDNQIIYYRIGIKAGDYSSGATTVQLRTSAGSISGVVRITGYTNRKVVSAVVLKDLGRAEPSKDWYEGEWSTYRGWPSAAALHDARLFITGKDKVFASAIDDYEGFDSQEEGDSAAISRSIGFGPHLNIHWVMSLANVLVGTANNSANLEPVVIDANNPLNGRSSSFGEPITQNNFNMKTSNASGIFVDRSYQRVYQIMAKSDGGSMDDYQAFDLMLTVPDLNEMGIVHIALQQKPDQRLHVLRSDGTVALLVFDRGEDLLCWVKMETPGASGFVEDIVVQPGIVEDEVYYTVRRTIGGETKRYHEKWALESEAMGGQLNKQADSYVIYDGEPVAVITGLAHLEGQEVVVWGDGKDLGKYTVSDGEIAVSQPVSKACIGLYYQARYKSNKLVEEGPRRNPGPRPNERTNVRQIGFMMHKTHRYGVKYGPSFNRLYDLPAVEKGEVLDENKLWEQYDSDTIPFGGTWSTDSRICLLAESPKPCTMLAVKAVLVQGD